MWHAWHFQFALSSVVTAPCGSFCIACLHPLTRRYVFFQHQLVYRLVLGLLEGLQQL
ncbi:TPA: DUF3265 domain-containing protein [Vibrio vulnificus]|nr:DUF3265 domain-containing protein [Vibrio vulnificus]HDY7594410.1 DUF3265 domain-containing protein [Vibrio vulnificus]HDY8178521.1 DUF3265 domain-containing protein [Vibrio vulnificus]